MRFLLSLLALCLSLSLSAQEVIMTGILDGDLQNAGGQGGNPKVIELYVNGSVDLTGYQLSRTNNNNVFTFPAGSNYADEFVYVVNPAGETQYLDAYGSSGDFANYLTSGQIVGNGNDPYQLLNSTGTVIDQTGGPIGASNNYQDGHRYRVSNTGPDGGWVEANWTGGNGTVDNQTVSAYAGITMFGTYTIDPPGPASGVTANGDLTEPSTDGGFTLTLSETATTDVTITYTLSGSATIGSDYTDPNGGSAIVMMGNTSVPLPLEVMDDGDSEPTETIELTITGVSDATYSTGASAIINVFDDEPVSAILISFVQGTGTSSQLVGQTVSIEGIVVGDFQGSDDVGLGGFFVQEEDADADADPLTSEGIWVFDNAVGIDVNEGDKVTVTGQIGESDGLTQIDVSVMGGSVVVVSSSNPLPTAASLNLPVSAESDYEAFEGMLTTVIDPVYITRNFTTGRFGDFEVSEEERLIQFTECNTPDPAQLATYNDQQSLRKLLVDDGRGGQNLYPIILGNGQEVSATNSLRAGAVINDLTGIIDERFTGYRMQGTDFTVGPENARPVAAPSVGGFVKVVGMNVLNYFITLNSRGANDADEFDRQEAKIVAGIIELDADIIGLAEIENLGANGATALEALIAAITAAGGPTYDYVVNPNPGGDQIMIALIYKPDVVEESGTAANLTIASGYFGSNRVPLAQTFRVIEPGHMNFGQQVTVCANHWKSKAGSCSNTSPDDDSGGAGSCNGTRLAGATAILNWLTNDDPTGTGITDQLVVGDLNAYSEEAPVTVFTDAGWSNTVRDANAGNSFPCGSVPSYVFRSEWGSLDHILASPSLAAKVTGATPWQVNAPEPIALDYDTRFNNPALYAPDFYRFSDHDPVVVGLNLGNSLPVALTSFMGEVDGKVAVLNWRTEAEEQTERFDVERRTTNGDFVAIGTIAAAGNSTVALDYAFTDEVPATGANDYRLRMIDQDGSFEFSQVVTLSFRGANGASLRQVAPGQLQLSGAEAGAEYLFTNAAGAVLRRGTTGETASEIDANTLPAGIYFLLLREPVAGAKTLKVVLR